MVKKKKTDYISILLWLIGASAFVFGLTQLKYYPILCVVLLITIPCLSVIFYFNPNYKVGNISGSELNGFLFAASLLTGIYCFYANSRESAYLDKELFGGRIHSMDEDGEDGDGNPTTSTKFYVVGGNEENKTIVNWTFLILTIACPVVSTICYNHKHKGTGWRESDF